MSIRAIAFSKLYSLAAIPIVLSAINSRLALYASTVDPWYNVAYFLHYGDPSLELLLKSSRLSWIIPGFRCV